MSDIYISESLEYWKLMRDVPMISKGVFVFDEETGYVFRPEGFEHRVPLRVGISQYLWLLRTEPGYFRRVKDAH